MKKFIFLILPMAALLIILAAAGILAQERPGLHRSIFEVFFQDVDQPQSRISLGISHKADPKVISRYTEKKKQAGTYVRTQFNVLICEDGPCEQQWSAAFVYTDEMGKSDTFGLIWKQIVFSGITPSGTIKRELNFCLNGKCEKLEDPKGDNALGRPQDADIGRYHIRWTTSSFVITRLDIS
jgi:hypothetical protein